MPGDRCGVLSTDGGNFSCAQHSLDEESCVLACNPGYTLHHSNSHSNHFVCNKSDGWESGIPYCEAIDCGPFLLPKHHPGSVTCSGTKLNDECVVSCSLGYDLDEPSVPTCQENGIWSNANISCIPITCPPLVQMLSFNGRTLCDLMDIIMIN